MADIKNGIAVHFCCDCDRADFDLDKIEKLIENICHRFGVQSAVVDIAIVADEVIEKVNSEFLDKAGHTDVISFDLSDEKDRTKTFELVVNAEEAVRQGGERGHSTLAELALYITHGLLHNLGFNDAEPDDARKMHNMEDEILQHTGFGKVFEK